MTSGERHTRLLESIMEALKTQHGDAFLEADDATLIIPSGCTPQTAYVKIDVSWLADVALAEIDSAPQPRAPEVEGDRARDEHLQLAGRQALEAKTSPLASTGEGGEG